MNRFILLFLLLIPFAYADDITFIAPQQEFTFVVGQPAAIEITVENSYEYEVIGNLRSEVEEVISQQGFMYSNTNTQTTTFTTPAGERKLNLDLGIHNQPKTLRVDIRYMYDTDARYELNLDTLIVNIVQQQQEQQQQQQETQASGERQQAQQRPQTQNRLQNNQVAQDTQALKEQLAQETQEQQEMKDAFAEALQNNAAFQEAYQEQLDKGFEPQSSSSTPLSNNTGNFSVTMENADGEQIEMEGSLEEGELTELEVNTVLEDEDIFALVEQEELFQQYRNELVKDMFIESKRTVSREKEQTIVTYTYENDGQKAEIIATVDNAAVTSIDLQRPRSLLIWIIVLSILLLAFVGYFFPRKKTQVRVEEQKPYDHRKEARVLLRRAKTAYAKKPKEAYGLVGQALRLFLSYELKREIELTNEEVVALVSKTKYPAARIEDILTKCSVVAFAKGKPKKTEFQNLCQFVSKQLQSKKS